MRARQRLAIACAALALAGCGGTFELPNEAQVPRGFPSDGSYQRIANWTGMEGVADIVLTQGSGSQLFVVFRASASGPARVVEYPLTNPNPLDFRLDNLIQPAAAAYMNNRLFVLDQGDTGSARITDTTCVYDAPCGLLNGFNRPLVHLDRYWKVVEYDLNGDSLTAFTDTTMAFVNGIAVDSDQRVYVSGVIIFCDVDPFDPRLKTLEFQHRVYRYVRGGSDPDVPNAPWQRDRSYEVSQGTGIGYTVDPGQMTWDGYGGSALYFADRGNDEVQKLATPGSGASSYKIDEGDSLLLETPGDMALDRAGFLYVVDGGNRRVLRYDAQGEFVQRVDFDVAIPSPPLVTPVAVAADDSLVYVADAGANMIIRYKRR